MTFFSANICKKPKIITKNESDNYKREPNADGIQLKALMANYPKQKGYALALV